MVTTIQVNDNASPTPNPIVGAYVSVWMPDEVTLVAAGYTNSLGQVVFATPSTLPQVVDVAVKKDLVQFPASTSASITVDGATFTTVGVPNPATPPGPLSRCTVFGYIFRPDGHPEATTVIVDTIGWDTHAQIAAGGTTQTGNPATAMVQATKQELRSNAQTGYWGIDLVQNARCRLYIPNLGVERFFTVPELTTCNVVDLVPDARSFYLGVLAVQPATESIKS